MAPQNNQAAPAADPYAGLTTPTPAGAVAAPAQSTQTTDPYAGLTTPTPAPLPSMASRAGSALLNNSPIALVKPPETPTEQVLDTVLGPGGLAAFRAAKGLVGSVQNVVSAGPEAYANAVKDLQRAHQEFINKDYRNAAASAGSLATDVNHIIDPALDSTNQTRQLTERTRPGADLTTPLVGQITQAGLALAGAKLAGAEPGAASEAAATETPSLLQRMNPFRPKVTADTVQPALRSDLQGTWNKVADEAGVPRPTATSIRDMGEQVADSILARSKTLYRAIDEATGNRFSGTATKLQNVVQKMRTVTTDAEEQALLIEKTRYEMQIDQMFDDAAAKATGVTKRTVDAAKAEFKKAQAIYDTNQQIRMSTQGIRPGEPGAEGSPEVVNPKQLQNRLNKMQDSGRLQQGVGEANGKQMIGHTGTAEGTTTKAAAEAARVAHLKKVAIGVGGTAATAAGAGLVKHAIDVANP